MIFYIIFINFVKKYLFFYQGYKLFSSERSFASQGLSGLRRFFRPGELASLFDQFHPSVLRLSVFCIVRCDR